MKLPDGQILSLAEFRAYLTMRSAENAEKNCNKKEERRREEKEERRREREERRRKDEERDKFFATMSHEEIKEYLKNCEKKWEEERKAEVARREADARVYLNRPSSVTCPRGRSIQKPRHDESEYEGGNVDHECD